MTRRLNRCDYCGLFDEDGALEDIASLRRDHAAALALTVTLDNIAADMWTHIDRTDETYAAPLRTIQAGIWRLDKALRGGGAKP